MDNLFADLPARPDGETVTTLLETPAARIERIASFGHASPDGFWYDQHQDEWVAVLRGTATLVWADGRRDDLSAGDFRFIPAHARHRVARTDPDTIWLAVHLPDKLPGK
jgi:cupin 2 domain-containing protein